jgi:nucleotide-binding universal stress UspA family protein
MVSFKKILVPTDFSDHSEHALRYANAFAKLSGGTIDCVHVVDTTFLGDVGHAGAYVTTGDIERSVESMKAQAEKELRHFVRKEKLLGTEVKPHLRQGHAAEEIVAVADEISADLIVIPTHGRSGLDRLVFGGTCDKVLRSAKVPVLVVKLHEHDGLSKDGKLSLKTVLCPMDFSAFSRSALPLAHSLCKQFGAELTLAHIVDTRFDYPEWTAQVAMNNSEYLLKAATENLDRTVKELSDIKTKVHVSLGVPHRTLIDATSDNKVDLVVIPTHGRKGVAHALMGSVAEKVVRGAQCPVLVVRPKG